MGILFLISETLHNLIPARYRETDGFAGLNDRMRHVTAAMH